MAQTDNHAPARYTFEVRQKPDDEGYEVWNTAGYLAATHPMGGLPIEDAALFAASGDLLEQLRDAIAWAESEPSDNQTYREAIARWKAAAAKAGGQ